MFSVPSYLHLNTRGLLCPETEPWEACCTHPSPSLAVWEDYEIETRQLRAQLASHCVTWFSLEPPPSNHAFDQQLLFRFLVPQELSPLAWHKALSLLAFQILRKQKLFPLPPTLVSPLVGTGVSVDSRTQRVAPLDISRSGLSNFSLRTLLGCPDTLVLGAASDVQVFSD